MTNDDRDLGARRRAGALLAAAAVLLGGPSLAVGAEAPPATADSPVHTISVSGDGVELAPAYDASVERFAVRTTATTAGGTEADGELTVTATTDDPGGVVRVDGHPVTGPTTITGLEPGEEVSVVFEDAGGTEPHALVYLPPDFPDLEVTVDEPGAGTDHVLLTLTDFLATTPQRSFEVAVDRHGVPAYLRVVPADRTSLDLVAAPGGHYAVMRGPTPTAGRSGTQLVELDERFEPVATFEVEDPLTNTDAHDAILRPDGSRILLGYEPVAGRLDPTIQEIAADGTVVRTWHGADHLDLAETTNTPGAADWAHTNSVVEMAGGDLLVSFRHLSSVMRIAWSAHDGFEPGDVVWRLGGRESDFAFVGDPWGGPCAQHTATELPDGHILVFDNGSGVLGENPSYCVDPEDPGGATVDRTTTRVAEYALDEQAGTATLVWQYDDPSRFAYFAGSARRLTGGNTLIGWASAQHALATEVSAAGDPVWELHTDSGYFSYRAAAAPVPDATPPTIAATLPGAGAHYAYGEVVTPVGACSDRGGSALLTCDLPPVPTTGVVGKQVWSATATDVAGNTTTLTRHYYVDSPADVDVAVRVPGGAWSGTGHLGRLPVVLRHPGAVRTVVVRLRNDGDVEDRVGLTGPGSAGGFAVEYRHDGADVTRRIVRGTYRTAPLAPGASERVVLRVERGPRAERGTRRRLELEAASGLDPRRGDRTSVVALARRRPPG